MVQPSSIRNLKPVNRYPTAFSRVSPVRITGYEIRFAYPQTSVFCEKSDVWFRSVGNIIYNTFAVPELRGKVYTWHDGKGLAGRLNEDHGQQ